MRHPVLWAFGALAGGIGLADATRLPSPAWLGATAALAAVTLLAARRRRGAFASALLTLFAAGGAAAALRAPPLPLASTCGESVWRGRIDAPIERQLQPVSGRITQRTALALEAERCAESWQPRRGRVAVALWGDAPLARGDAIELRLRLEPFAPPRNPTDPDDLERARAELLSARAAVLSPHAVVRRGRGPLAWLDGMRRAAALRFERLLPPESAALAKALAIGDEGALTAGLRERWSDAGTAHLLAVSGLQVSLIAAALFFVVRRAAARLPGAGERYSLNRAAAALTLPAIALFCLWCGAGPAAVRATVMAGAALVGILAGRPSAVPNALGIAGAAILLVDPTSLYDTGFLLSFTGVAALLILPHLPPVDGWRRARRALYVALLASLFATLLTAPILAHRFGRISLIAPLSNLPAVPLGNLACVPLALLLLAAAPFGETVSRALAMLLDLSLRALDGLSKAFGGLPGAALDVPRPALAEILAYAALLVALLTLRRARAARWAAGASVAVLLSAVGLRVSGRAGDGRLHVLHPYVGQGDAAIVVLPEGGVVLFDAGGSLEAGDWDPGRAVVAPLLRRAGIRSIDLAIVSHAHPDHIGGFAYLVEHFPLRELWWSGAGAEVPAQQALVARVLEKGGIVRLAAELPPFEEREGVRFEVLHPRPGDEAEGLTYFPEMHANDNSIALRLTYGERTLLLPGDVERTAEAHLAPLLERVDVFKSPHHGSDTSSTQELLRALAPAAVVISCGHKNRFHFPSAAVLGRYAVAHIALFRTDEDGMIEMVSDGRRWEIRAQRGKSLAIDSSSAPP